MGFDLHKSLNHIDQLSPVDEHQTIRRGSEDVFEQVRVKEGAHEGTALRQNAPGISAQQAGRQLKHQQKGECCVHSLGRQDFVQTAAARTYGMGSLAFLSL